MSSELALPLFVPVWRDNYQNLANYSFKASEFRPIDDKLSWNFHIEKLTKKIASVIGAMKRARYLVPPATLHLIYQALIQPHFDYCSTVWGTCGVSLLNKLQKLQK